MLSLCAIFAVTLTNCTDVMSCIFAQRTGDSFDLTGQVIVNDNNGDPVLNMTDATGGTKVMGVRHVIKTLPFKSGDIIRATGVIDIPPDSRVKAPSVICRSVRRVATGTLPPPVDVSAADVLSGRYECRVVRVRGRIRRIFCDEIAAKWIYMPLAMRDGTIYLTTEREASAEKRLRGLIDAEIEVTGLCSASVYSLRRFIGSTVGIKSINDISIVTPAQDDPYKVPMLEFGTFTDMYTINQLGRRRILGTVIAVCSGGRIIVQTDKGNRHDIILQDCPIPSSGNMIEAVGIPEADYYQINLVDAMWRPASGKAWDTTPPVDVTIGQLMTDGKGHTQLDPNFHGKTIRTKGTLIDLPTKESGRDFGILKDDGGTILLDISSAKELLDTLSGGCTISVTGICTVNRETSANPQLRFQQLNGITLVVRKPDDVTILARPPWWTPGRLAVVITVLFVLLATIFIWNRLLQRVINRKSRQLLRENIANIKASLRIDERTNLAVELHDSLSQNLSGVACQIAATKGTLRDESNETARYLATAEKMLSSCRTELRRCLWDLRENALDENDFATAIRKTLVPVAIGVETQIRFDVPRNHVNDRTAHSILCIIRELVSNAIRHGKASALRIEGHLQGDGLLFSVADDGCGFDPDAAAGANEGHFGIEGIRERIKRLGGKFTLKSAPGNGCTATATIPLTT